MNDMNNGGPHELHEYASSVTKTIEQLGIDGLHNLEMICLKESPELEVEGYPYDVVVWDCDRMIGGEVGESADFVYYQVSLCFYEGDEESYTLYDVKREKVYDFYYNFPKYLFGEE